MLQGSANGLLHHASGALAESVHSGAVGSSRVVSHPDLPPSAAARVVLIRCLHLPLHVSACQGHIASWEGPSCGRSMVMAAATGFT